MELKQPLKKSLVIPCFHQLNETEDAAVTARLLIENVKPVAIDVNNWPDQYPPSPSSLAYLAHNGKRVFVLYAVAPYETRCTVTEDLGPVADDNCVEIFMRKPGSPRYWNFEFNFGGFLNASNRVTRPRPTRLDAVQRSEVTRQVLNPADFNLPHDGNTQYTLMMLISIPLSLMDVELHGVPTLIEGNLYSLSEKVERPYYMTWSPIVEPTEDFHRPEHFGYFIFQ